MTRGRKLLLLMSLLCAGSVLVHTFLAPDGWRRRARAKADLAAVNNEIQEAQARVTELRAQIDAMRTHPAVQERVVRAELGYVRPDDAILELPVRAASPTSR